MRVLTATRAGAGVARPPASGRVVGLFREGFYVRVAERLFAVGGPGLPAGPLHVVLAEPPPLPPETSSVSLVAGRLETASCVVDLSRALAHDPMPPRPDRLHAVAAAISSLDRWTYVPDDLASIWGSVRAAPDLDASRELLEGRGSGLTPAGDDVLAALLLFARWRCPDSSLPMDVARKARTTDLSRGFLYWAALGQSIEPVHRLIEAAERLATASDDACSAVARERLDAAVAVVAAIGGSSGKAMLAGFGLAASACDEAAGRAQRVSRF